MLTYLSFWFFPETKGLSLEEMDVLFGSAGFAAADNERMREINREIGLDDVVRGESVSEQKDEVIDEKTGTKHKETASL